MKGVTLPATEWAQIVARLARYTGLSSEYIERADLRIEIFRFTKELLRTSGQTVGRIDSRFKGVDRDAAGEAFEFDPSMAAIISDLSRLLGWQFSAIGSTRRVGNFDQPGAGGKCVDFAMAALTE